MPPEVKYLAVYSRKSKFTGKGESIENQIELCRQYIQVHFSEIDESSILIYEDEGFSGGNLERPQFKRMMKDAREGKFSAIICYRLDRISRNIGDFANLIEELNNLKCSFISIKEQFDTSSPMGRAMMYIASVFSQLERETIAERIRDNMHELAKTGRWLGGTTPTGYSSEPVEKVTVDGKVRKAYKLSVIPEEAKLIQMLFSKFIETNSLTKTETFLIQNNYRTKNDKQFTRFAIKHILENPVYLIADAEVYRNFVEIGVDLFSEESDFDGIHGIMAYNKTIQKRGKASITREMEEWIISVGKHEGLISSADWFRVQSMLKQNKSKSYRKPRSNVALLSGLLFCGHCGDYMRPKVSLRRTAKGDFIYTYLCQLKEKSRCKCCNHRNANGNMLDALVCAEIKHLAEDSSVFIQRLEMGKKLLLENREEYDDQLEQLRKVAADNDKDIAALISALTKAAGSNAEEYIIKQIEDLHQKVEGTKQRIKELESLTQQHVLSDIEFDIIRGILSDFKYSFDEMSVEQKRAALRSLIKKVIWDGENAHIYLFCAGDDEISYPPTNDDPSTNRGSEENVSISPNIEPNYHLSDTYYVEPLCEHSKRNSDAFPQSAQTARGGFPVGQFGL